jgi:hypothetical protein
MSPKYIIVDTETGSIVWNSSNAEGLEEARKVADDFSYDTARHYDVYERSSQHLCEKTSVRLYESGVRDVLVR